MLHSPKSSPSDFSQQGETLKSSVPKQHISEISYRGVNMSKKKREFIWQEMHSSL